MITKTEVQEFLGKPMIAIYEAKENGTHSERAIIQFGAKKAQAILASIDGIRKFLDEIEAKKK